MCGYSVNTQLTITDTMCKMQGSQMQWVKRTFTYTAIRDPSLQRRYMNN